IPDTAVPTVAAARKPNTLRRLSNAGLSLTQLLTSHAMSKASAALHTANTMDAERFLSASKFAASVASITPRATANRQLDPTAMIRPDATPAAGQKTATPLYGVVKARLRRAAK